MFAAVKVSSQVSQNLGHFVERMRGNPEVPPKTVWVDEKNFHFTLKFFGEVSDPMIQNLENALAGAASIPPFEVTLRSIGAFPALSHPRVIWAGVEDPSGGFARLADAIEKATVDAGFAAADKPFSPHLTLARLNHTARPGLPKVLERSGDTFFGAMAVDHLALVKSTLTAKGPVYEDLRRWSLK
ncbi:MAG: 2'-5' RNA ligase [Elusimicrobia bacterium RIFCSPLOWO2_01_FULL_60_11]|nr:MAG: 2'-5' RNA ligase [Elusimicrobia bacterium RIFCSPLOWO2_01_FULL_60_11]